ncbi:MAG TPA: 30S ribosomal protein S7 [Blastocatellia bacterium]|nr:30S ribosomal protein S7 [Blastocatellia bacterium]
MPRRRVIARREILPDPVYNSPLVAKFINVMMWDGKRSVSEGILYSALDIVKDRTQEDPLKVFKKAIENLQPKVEVKSKRVGGANYQVPVEVNAQRRTALAMRWLVSYARERGEKTMIDRLAAEILDAAAGKGNAVKKKDDVHRMAEANKAFAHYRW